ncbi:Ff.00g116820.m01.CDS01 [Fusarium sp. VM40]|nr:Ff.00g116820.m01.CDS01 [Fusarium sp. VM40]
MVMKVDSKAEENMTTSSFASSGPPTSLPSFVHECLYNAHIQHSRHRKSNDNSSSAIYSRSMETTSKNDVTNILPTSFPIYDTHENKQQLNLLSAGSPVTAVSVRSCSQEERFIKNVQKTALLSKSPISVQPQDSITASGPTVPTQSPINHSSGQNSSTQGDNRVQNQDFKAFKYDIPGLEFMYRFPGASDLYVGFEDIVRPDTTELENWHQRIEPRLLTDIKEFQKKMMKSSKVRWGRSGPLISPQLRMSGHSVTGTTTITLLPCIWILYDKAKWKRDVQKFVRELEWLECEGFGKIEVHKGANLAALDGPSFVSGLDLDETQALHLQDGTSLHLHLESPQGVSACGLLCCATLTRHGAVLDQRLSRIGGLISVDGVNFGATTAHGLMECLWGRGSETADSSNESCDLESLGSDGSDSEMSQDQSDEEEYVELLGGINASSITGWDHSLMTGGIGFLDNHACDLESFIQQSRASPELPPEYNMVQNTNGGFASSANQSPVLRGSDFTLLRNGNIDDLKNTYTTKDLRTIEVDTVFTWDDASAGPVQLLLGHDQVLGGILIPGSTSLVMHGFEFKSRKIRTTGPLAQGCSGSWVVRDRQLCGVIIASYEAEPYVHIITACDMLLDISALSDPCQSKGTVVPLRGSHITKSTDNSTESALSVLGVKLTQVPRQALSALSVAWPDPMELSNRRLWQKRIGTARIHQDESHGHANSSVTEFQELISENIPYIDPETIRNQTQDLVYCFITKYNTEKLYHAEAEYLSTLIEPHVPLAFLDHRSRLPSRTVARIYDLKSNRINMSSSKDYGALGVEQFYHILSEKRFQHPEEYRRDRRLIYMADPDQHSMVALMLTASKSQTSALGRLFYQHMALKPHLGPNVLYQSSGPFTFSFSFPFYSLQCGKKAPADHRRKTDGTPLRKVQKLITHPMDDQEDYLYESQISVLVTGINSRVWTSYCLLDTYYKQKSTSRSPDEYDDAKALLHGFRDNSLGIVDPLPCIPILDPGEYFLQALEGQVRMLLQEWNHTTEILYCRFRAYAGKESFLSSVNDIEVLEAFNILRNFITSGQIPTTGTRFTTNRNKSS